MAFHLASTAKFSVIEYGQPSKEPPKSKKAASALPASAPKTSTSGSSPASSLDFDALTAAVTKQQSAVKMLKKSGASPEEMAAATAVLDKLRTELAVAQDSQAPTVKFPRKGESEADFFHNESKSAISSGLTNVQAPDSLMTCRPMVVSAFEDTIVRKMFVIPSFEIHGGVKGLFDLGPPCCALKANIIDVWRKHFVLEENMLEVWKRLVGDHFCQGFLLGND